jgi:hypothetical protein
MFESICKPHINIYDVKKVNPIEFTLYLYKAGSVPVGKLAPVNEGENRLLPIFHFLLDFPAFGIYNFFHLLDTAYIYNSCLDFTENVKKKASLRIYIFWHACQFFPVNYCKKIFLQGE